MSSTATSSRPDPRLVVFTLWALVFAVGSQAMLVAPIIPQISAQLGTGEARLGALVTAYAASVGVFALVTGPVSDRVGRRRVLLAGTALMTGALALHGLADSFLALLVVRALAGAAGGVLNGAAIAYVGDYFPPGRRGWANGWVISGFAAGQVAGIPIGTLLAASAGFRIPFLAFAVGTLLALGLVYAILPQPPVERATGRLTVRRAASGYATLLSRREVAAATLVFVVMFGGSTLYVTFLPAWLVASRGATASAIAALFLVGGLANAVIGPVSGSLSDRVGRRRIIVVASVGLALAMAATPFVGGLVAIGGTFVVAMGLFASRASSFTTLLTELVEDRRRGSLMSLTVGVGQLGVGVGGALAGAAYAGVGYPASAVAAGALMLVIAVLVHTFLPKSEAPRPPGSLTEAPEPPAPEVAIDAIAGPTGEGGYVLDDDDD